jgi:hypothetical protein
MNDVETTLRSWRPRRVTARIEDSLFGAEPTSTAHREQVQTSAQSFRLTTFPWLAPVTAAILLLSVFRNQLGPQVSVVEAESFAAAALSNQTAAAWLPGSFAAEQNNVPVSQRLEWTNLAGSTSSTRSISGSRATD